MRSLSEESVNQVLKNHQLLLFCVGLSSAIDDGQQRSKSIGNTSEYRSISEESHHLVVPILLAGIRSAVGSVEGYEVSDNGLSVLDAFYSKVIHYFYLTIHYYMIPYDFKVSLVIIGLEHIVGNLIESKTSLQEKRKLFSASYGLASSILSSLTVASQGEGAEVPTASISSNVNVRTSMGKVVELLQLGSASQVVATSKFYSHAREGKRVADFCSLLLKVRHFNISYHHPYYQSYQDMQEESQGSYQHAKVFINNIIKFKNN